MNYKQKIEDEAKEYCKKNKRKECWSVPVCQQCELDYWKSKLIESYQGIDSLKEDIIRWFDKLIVRTDYDRGYGCALKTVIDKFDKE